MRRTPSRLRIPSGTLKVLRLLAREAGGLPVYVAGGCVRDWLLGRESRDLDLVVEGDAERLARACGRRLKAEPRAFGQFGTLRVIGRDWRVDFAASREEKYPEPACLPKVQRPVPIERDLFRRDFTINAMAVPLTSAGVGGLIDPYGGEADLRAGVLRVLHDQSFRDDPTRVFRAVRYLCRLDLRPAPGLAALARKAKEAGYPELLSRHRILQEFLRVLEEREPRRVLETLRRWRYLELIHPDIRWPRKTLPGVQERLALIALEMGVEQGMAFLKTLPIERPFAAGVLEALEVARRRATPRGALSPLARRVLAHAFPRLASGALRPLWLSGDDLKARGLEPGETYREILDEAAAAQWSGRIRSRRQALAWLSRREIRGHHT